MRAASHRVIKRGRGDEDGLPYARGTKFTGGQAGNPLGEPFKGHLGEGDVPPCGEDMEIQQGPVLMACLWLQVGPRVEPGIDVLAEGDAAKHGIGPVAVNHEGSLLRQPAFSVTLAFKALASLAAVRTVVPRPPGVPAPLNAHATSCCWRSQAATSSG